MHCTVVQSTVLYCTIEQSIVLYCTIVQSNTLLYCTIPYCIILYLIVLSSLHTKRASCFIEMASSLPVNTNSLAGETRVFVKKTYCSWAICKRRQKHPIGKIIVILMPLQPLNLFLSSLAPKGLFWPFVGPLGPKMGYLLFGSNLEGA